MESTSLAGLLVVYIGVLPAGHALWADVGGGITFVTSGESTQEFIKIAYVCFGDSWAFRELGAICASLSGTAQSPCYDACMVYWIKGAPRRTCREKQGKTSCSPNKIFLFSRNSKVRFWGLVLWHLWIGRAKHPGPCSPCHLAIEVFNVGGWLTHGDLALDVELDFLAVTEHRLIPARVRSEWARLKREGVASIWAPASQDSSHVGNAGVGVISMQGAPFALLPLLLPSFRGFLIAVGRFGACFLLVLVGSCIWLFCTVIRERIMMLSSFR